MENKPITEGEKKMEKLASRYRYARSMGLKANKAIEFARMAIDDDGTGDPKVVADLLVFITQHSELMSKPSWWLWA
jgi:hypothetical protein